MSLINITGTSGNATGIMKRQVYVLTTGGTMEKFYSEQNGAVTNAETKIHDICLGCDSPIAKSMSCHS